jgi:hypothetical protein
VLECFLPDRAEQNSKVEKWQPWLKLLYNVNIARVRSMFRAADAGELRLPAVRP